MTRRRSDLWKGLGGLGLLGVSAGVAVLTPYPVYALVFAPVGLVMLVAGYFDRRAT